MKEGRKTGMREASVPAEGRGLRIFCTGLKTAPILPLLTFLSFLVHLIGFWKYHHIYVIPDEAGYWAGAALLSGDNWSSLFVAFGYPYYAYGYSLLLAPLYALISDGAALYRVALLLNSLMMAAVVPVAYRTARNCFPGGGRSFQKAVSFSLSMFPAALLHSRIAWSECLLFFLFWVCACLVSETARRPSVWKYVVLALTCVYCYMVHQRMLSCLVATGLVVLVRFLRRETGLKAALVFVLSVIGMFIAHVLIKRQVQGGLYGWASMVKNDYGSVLLILKEAVAGQGWMNLLSIFAGSLFYAGMSTLLLFYDGMVGVAGAAWGFLKPLGRRHPRVFVDEENKASASVSLFLVTAVVLAFGINAVFCARRAGNVRYVFYGRYIETVMAPVLLFSLCRSKEESLRAFAVGMLVFLGAGAFHFNLLRDLSDIDQIVSPAMAWCVGTLRKNGRFLLLMIPVAAVLYGLAVGRAQKAAKVLALCLLLGGFIYAGFSAREMHAGRAVNPEDDRILDAICENLDSERRVFYLSPESEENTEHSISAARLQYMLRTPLSVLTGGQALERVKEAADGDYIVQDSGEWIPTAEALSEEAHLLLDSERYTLWVMDRSRVALADPQEGWWVNENTVVCMGKSSPRTYRGFHEVEYADGIYSAWTKGISELYFRFAAPSGATLRLSCLPLPGELFDARPSMKLQVHINGRFVEERVLTRSTVWAAPLVFSLPGEAMKDRDLHTLTLSCESWKPMDFLPGSTDNRELGLRVVCVEISSLP